MPIALTGIAVGRGPDDGIGGTDPGTRPGL
jgi:hypothetical protein